MRTSRTPPVVVSALALLLAVACARPAYAAQEPGFDELKRQIAEMQVTIKQMAERIEQLENARAMNQESGAAAAREQSGQPSAIRQPETPARSLQTIAAGLNPSIGVAIDATAEHRSSAGGRFNFRAAELSLSASVDPYARAYAFITGSDEGVEVEEAAVVTTSLPWNLQARAGRLFADFGRLPKFHEHELPFVNMPVAIERLVGGESKADGLELNYLFPTPFFLSATLGGYNKIGAENDRIENGNSRAWSRFTYLGRLHTSFDLGADHSVDFGTSLAHTPSVRLVGTASGGTRTLGGLDVTYRYQPPGSTFHEGLTIGAELFGNSERVLRSSGVRRMFGLGGYAYAEAKLTREWSAGFLFDHAPGLRSPGRKTIGYSPFVTWNLSEFNRLRLQYTYLDDKVREEREERGHQFFAQWTIFLGAHAHGFRTR